MAQLKVIVKKLNKRAQPVADFSDKNNIKGTVFNGYLFQGEESVTNTLGKWYVDRDGYFYWGGGVTVVSATNETAAVVASVPEAGKATIPLPKAPPRDLPLTQAKCVEMGQWMETHFGEKCEAAVADTPFTRQLLYALVCKETAIYVIGWIRDHSPDEILARCVFDASGDANGTRRAFPKNTAEFVTKYGQAKADELIAEANKTRALRGWGPKPWVYAGYGIFQYDIQHILTDESFFTQKLWYNIDDCVDRVMSELNTKWRNNVNDLFGTVRAYNGSGPAAENYANSVLQFLEWINKSR